MAWSAPPTAVTGAIITAAFWNTGGRDNLNDLDRRTSPANAYRIGPDTTTATAFGDLAGPVAGPAVTVTIGSVGKALVTLSANLENNTSNAATLMTYAVTGATTHAADDDKSIAFTAPLAGAGIRAGQAILHSALTAGSTTFSSKFRVVSNTGTYRSMRLSVTPLGS